MELTVSTTGVGRLVREPGFTTGWRILPWLTVQVVFRGRYRLDHGVSTLALPAQSVWFIPAGCRHRHSVDGSTPVETGWWQGDVRLHGAIDAFGSCGTPRLLPGGLAGPIGHALLHVLDAPMGESLASVLLRQGRSTQLAGAIAEVVAPDPVDPQTAVLAPVFRFIDAHLHLPLSRPELAERAGLSPSRFHARFLRVTGITPMAWVRHRRLARAADLVVSGSLCMTEIAAQVGLCDAYHLNKLFRAAYGMPPTTMRRQAQG